MHKCMLTHMYRDTHMNSHMTNTHANIGTHKKELHALKVEGMHKCTQTDKITLLSMIKGLLFLLQEKKHIIKLEMITIISTTKASIVTLIPITKQLMQ